ncbi:hypothetical protein ACWEQL_21645 [Kitasatospora sp. NPDC004240]
MRPAGPDPRRPRPVVSVDQLSLVSAPPRRARAPIHSLLPSPAPVRGRTAPSLLRPDHQRAILAQLAGAIRPGPDIDIPHLVELLATRQAVNEIPRKPARTTRSGVQLLLDMGPSMRPFLRDLHLLVRQLRSVTGQDEVCVLRFAGEPDLVGDLDGEIRNRPYRPPVSACAVLVATDAGIAAGASGTPPPCRRDWLALAHTVHGAGCPLILLVPYPPPRWPAWATRHLTLATWDRTTDVAGARRAADRAAGLARSPL